MIVIRNQAPFDHIIIKDFFSSIAYQEVWDELVFLRPRMGGPETTGASFNNQDPKDNKKRGVGVFLDSVYNGLDKSSIFFHTRNLFNDELTKKISDIGKSNYYFRHWRLEAIQDSIIAQYYDHGDFYKTHTDTALFSAVTTLFQTPKAFNGGKFVFPEFDYSIDLEDNMTLIFPSVLTHEVEEVSIEKSGYLLGRFSITNFITFRS